MSEPSEQYPVDRETIKHLYQSLADKINGKVKTIDLINALGTVSESAYRMMENGRTGNHSHDPFHATVNFCLKLIDGSENILGKGNKLTLDQVIDHKRPSSALSDKFEDYLELRYGKFIGYDRSYSAADQYQWYNETMRLWKIPNPPDAPAASLHFTGWATNSVENAQPFKINAVRVSPFLFTLLGYDDDLTHCCFQSVFTKQFPMLDESGEPIRNAEDELVPILSGFWGGVDNACHTAAFRGLLSTRPITKKMVDHIQYNHSVQPLFTSSDFDNSSYIEPPDMPPTPRVVPSPHIGADRTTSPKSK